MSIKIGKKWDNLCHGQRVWSSNGDVWLINDVITASRDLPVLYIPMEHLNIDYKIGEMELREFVQHMRQVIDADLSYPILLDEKGAVLDGRHRIAKALLNEEDVIKAKRFIEEVAPSFTEKQNGN